MPPPHAVAPQSCTYQIRIGVIRRQTVIKKHDLRMTATSFSQRKFKSTCRYEIRCFFFRLAAAAHVTWARFGRGLGPTFHYYGQAFHGF